MPYYVYKSGKSWDLKFQILKVFLDYEENSFFDALIIFLKTSHTTGSAKLS